MADASNHIKSNGTPATTETTNNTTDTHSTVENGILSKSEPDKTEAKVVNGTASDGESTPVTKDEKSKEDEPGKMADAKLDDIKVENDADRNVVSTIASVTESIKMDTNNNDAVTPISTSMIKKSDEISDKTDDDMSSKNLNPDDKVVDDKKEESKNDDPPTATAPSRGVNKPLQGILSQSKHANGVLSEESPTKEITPGVGGSKEPGKT